MGDRTAALGRGHFALQIGNVGDKKQVRHVKRKGMMTFCPPPLIVKSRGGFVVNFLGSWSVDKN